MYLSCKQRRTVEEIKTSLQFPSGHGQSNGPKSPTLKAWLLCCTEGEPLPMGNRGWGFFVSALQTGFFWPLVRLYQIADKLFKKSALTLDLYNCL